MKGTKAAPALPTLALAALLALASGCATPCEELGRRICACQTAGPARDACNRAVRSEVQGAHASEAQQTFCEQKLDSCPNPDTNGDACAFMNTPEGKTACGLSY